MPRRREVGVWVVRSEVGGVLKFEAAERGEEEGGSGGLTRGEEEQTPTDARSNKLRDLSDFSESSRAAQVRVRSSWFWDLGSLS
ncbi:hypothetical protein ACFX2A_034785 [Malus domestica]